jgi:hypothetical protein
MLALACLGLLGMAGSASACSTAQWLGGAPGVVAGQPDDASPVPRYSGKCGALSAAVGQASTDTTPGAETAYRAQFYVYTGLVSGTARVFRAQSNAPADVITVDYNATAGSFVVNAGGSTTISTVNSVAIAQNKWYAIQLDWSNGGNLNVRVQGNNSLLPATATIAAGSGNIETVSLGWVSNGATPGATDGTHKGIVTDVFESRRATEIPRACRGDANGDGIYGVQDRIVMTNEILKLSGDNTKTISSFTPDANEDGLVSVQDRIIVTNFIIASPAKVCPTTAHGANET